MENFVLIIHMLLAIILVGLVLLQRSEGAGLVGPSASGMMPIRGSGNILTRTTAIVATCFFVTSITLALLAGGHSQSRSIADQIVQEGQTTAPAADVPVAPPTADTPSAPATAPSVK